MRRLGPRALSVALDGVVRDVEPATLLARVQALWPDAVGAGNALRGVPVSERAGVVTVACESAVWAHEFELLGPDLVARLGAAMGGAPGPAAAGSVKKLRFVVGSPPNQ
jgi:Dna[CI] antecedent, DciA